VSIGASQSTLFSLQSSLERLVRSLGLEHACTWCALERSVSRSAPVAFGQAPIHSQSRDVRSMSQSGGHTAVPGIGSQTSKRHFSCQSSRSGQQAQCRTGLASGAGWPRRSPRTTLRTCYASIRSHRSARPQSLRRWALTGQSTAWVDSGTWRGQVSALRLVLCCIRVWIRIRPKRQ
jgi:hypothetical protein